MRMVALVSALVPALALGPLALGAQDGPCLWVERGASLQAQIDAAPPGSTLCLPEGVWSENLIINKPLTIRGQGPERTIIQAAWRMDCPPVVWIQGAWVGRPIPVMIEGLTLLGRMTPTKLGLEGAANQGLLVTGFAQVVLHNCHITEALHGILLMDSAQAFVGNTRIQGEDAHRFRGTGIWLLGRSQALVVQSTITQVGNGISVERDAQITVDGSVIERTAFGVHVADDAQAIITRTEITDSADGVVVSESGKVTIRNCTFTDNGAGVVLGYHASAVVTDNVITGSRHYGLFLTMHDPRVWFAGFLVGARNVIPGPGEPGGNRYGAVFPDDIAFLMTEAGGVYPRR